MILQKTINEVMSTARIEDVVGDFVNLRRRGINLIGLCPFHDEKSPSFNVNPSRNIFKCFGCGKGGDSIQFIVEHEKISFGEAIRFLAQKYRIEIEETENTAEQIEQKLVTDSLYIVNEFARDYYVDVLFNRTEGRQIGLSYFKERGFLESTIRKWQLGYALEERDEFSKKALEKRYNIDHLHALGLTTKNEYDFFRSRVMFPIHNVSGKVLGFGGRTLSADKKIPKYINSPESEIYNKRNVLFGLYFAKDAIRKNDECILVEGYTDVITLHQAKIENVVAASGTSLTKEQIKLIKRFTPNIKIIFDGDPAGIKAALRGLDMVLESDMNVKLVLLPDGDDPDSYLAKVGPENFQQFLKENEEDFIFFKTRLLLNDAGDDPIRKTGVIKDIVQSIAKIPDTFKRALYIRQCSGLLQLSEDLFVSEVNKIIRADQKAKRLSGDNTLPDPDANAEEWLKTKVKLSPTDEPTLVLNDAYQERAICEILINFGTKIYDEETQTSIGQFIMANVMEVMDYFEIPMYRKILEDAFRALNNGTPLEASYFISHPEEEIRQFAIDALSTPYVYAEWEKREMMLQTQKMPDENYVNDCNSAILRLQLKKSKLIIKELEAKVYATTAEELENEEYIINLKILQVLMQQRNDIANKLRTVTLL